MTLEYGESLPESSRSGTGYPVYGSNGIVGFHEGYLVKGPGIVIGRKGSIGEVVWSNEPFWAIDTTYYVKPLGDNQLSWLYRILSHIDLRRLNSGTGVPGLNRNDVYALKVPAPSPADQRAIAHILDTLDREIQEISAIIDKLQQVKIGLFDDLLRRGLDEQGDLRDPHQKPELFHSTKLGFLPKSWEINRLESKQRNDRPFIKTGPFGSALKGEHWVDAGVPVITIGSLGEGLFNTNQLLFVSENTALRLMAYMVEPGDLVFSRVADVGRSVVITERERGWIISSNLMWITLDQSLVVPEYLHLNMVNNYAVRDQIRRFVNAGGREVANTPILKSMYFPFPPYQEQNAIVEVAQSHDARIQQEVAYRNKLHLLKSGLMNDLLTGRVNVSNIDIGTEIDDLR